MFAEVFETLAGRRLGELADGPHLHVRAAEWQTVLLRECEARRPAHLRTSEGGHEDGEGGRYPRREHYMDRVDGTDGREEYQAFLRERFAALEG